jgi:SAM-dependent methyltransferase
MRRMARNPWDSYAAIEPFFAVLANPKYLRANLNREAEAEFFATGDAYARHVLEVIRQRLARVFSPRNALEFGCGPGRVAIALAEHVPAVVAVDASPGMLALAKENARRRGQEHISFQTSDELFASPRRFDLVNASLVFQHIAPREGLPLLRALLGRLAPLGVGVFSFPYRRTGNAAVNLTRSVRRSVPAANAAVNVIRRKPPGFPFLHPYLYNLGEVLSVLREAGFTDPYVVAEQQDDLEVATIYVRRAAGTDLIEPLPDTTPRALPSTGFIDVRQLMAGASMDELHRKAEEYFSGLKEWDHHLAKPFANAADTPPILANVAVMIEGLRLHPGLTVLEFGGGTGWLSRFLTQLGCRVILTDVSPAALEIARELYRRLPPIGNKPEPRFLTFDGRRLDLADASVDRIITFDAFHHVTNPEAVLAEMARVLRPGGIAAFAEPGPHHSKTAQSQFEMRTYGVIENDVDIHAIWTAAQQLGFADLKLAAFTTHPMLVTLDEYDDLLQGGETYVRFAATARGQLTSIRDFFLYKEGQEPLDSRRAEGLLARIEVRVEGATVRAVVENSGTAEWLASNEPHCGVALGCHVFASDGALLNFDLHWEGVPSRVPPGGTVELQFVLPPLPNGAYELEFDMVANEVTWFAQVGSSPARVRV